jgi:RNA polymerase sigma factor (sigma-70 family)
VSSLTFPVEPATILPPERAWTRPSDSGAAVRGTMELITNPSQLAPSSPTSKERTDEAVRQEFMATVAESLQHLPQRQRQVVTMRYYESRSLEEISEMLDIREATVRTLLRHGVNNLRRHFKRSYLHDE